MTTLLVRELEFYAYHGYSDEEQAIGHRYLLSIEAVVAESASQSDALADTVDYGQLSAVALAVAQAPQSRMVEHVARRVALALLAEFGLLESVTVEMLKRMPPMPVVASAAGVRYTVARNQLA